MRPGVLSDEQTARLLGCPKSFVARLAKRGILRRGPSGYDAGALKRSRREHPWLRLLSRPLCDRELAKIDPRLRVPYGAGASMAGREYCPLWRALDAAWG